MTIDLTGVWSCDDQGTYYIRQMNNKVVWAGLHNSGFHKGIECTNVFWGTLSPDGQSVSGEWADVPRGGTEGWGNLRCTIQNADVNVLGHDFDVLELVQDPNLTTGGFGGKRWVKNGAPLDPQDIVATANQVQRYDGPLGDNNPPCRDFTVMWGTTAELQELHDKYPNRVSAALTESTPPPAIGYCSFVQSGRGWWSGGLGQGWSGDGDFTFNLVPAWNLTDPLGQFWANGWVPGPISLLTSQLTSQSMTRSQLIQFLYEHGAGGQPWGFFHCENMMYGRTNSDDDDDCQAPARVKLPGWMETSGNSILVNGRPIAGQVDLDEPSGEPPHFFSARREQ